MLTPNSCRRSCGRPRRSPRVRRSPCNRPRRRRERYGRPDCRNHRTVDGPSRGGPRPPWSQADTRRAAGAVAGVSEVSARRGRAAALVDDRCNGWPCAGLPAIARDPAAPRPRQRRRCRQVAVSGRTGASRAASRRASTGPSVQARSRSARLQRRARSWPTPRVRARDDQSVSVAGRTQREHTRPAILSTQCPEERLA